MTVFQLRTLVCTISTHARSTSNPNTRQCTIILVKFIAICLLTTQFVIARHNSGCASRTASSCFVWFNINLVSSVKKKERKVIICCYICCYIFCIIRHSLIQFKCTGMCIHQEDTTMLLISYRSFEAVVGYSHCDRPRK